MGMFGYLCGDVLIPHSSWWAFSIHPAWPVIAIAIEGDRTIAQLVDHGIYIPPRPSCSLPILEVAPLHLLAYHIAVRRGCDIDQPRNLAKSVTVE